MNTPINYGKLTPPSPKPHLLRHRLLGKLRAGVQCKLTLVCADAGFGKTTLLRDFIDATPQKVVWYRPSRADGDAGRFIEHLIAGVRQHEPDFGSRTLSSLHKLLRSAEEKDNLADLLAHEFGLIHFELLLVLDNYEELADSADVQALVRHLLDFAPRTLRFIIASRRVPSLPLPRLRTLGELAVISRTDLAFSVREVEELLVGQQGMALTRDQLEFLRERTEGWPAGLSMLCQTLRYVPSEEIVYSLAAFTGRAAVVYDYLADEVFGNLSQGIQTFLRRTSILNVLDPEVCDELLGTEDAGEVLRGLEADGLFTSSLDDDRARFRYHQLFREFLQQKLRDQESQAVAGELHGKAGNVLAARGEWDEAVGHFCAAGLHEEAARVIERVAEPLVETGRHQSVLRWVGLLPEEVVGSHPWLLAVQGRVRRRLAEYESALASLEAAARFFAARGDAAGQAWVAREVGEVYHRTGRFRDAIATLEPVLAGPGADTALRADVLRVLCKNHYGMDSLPEAIRHGEASLAEFRKLEPGLRRATGETRVARNIVHAYLQQGRLDLALDRARLAQATSRLGDAGESRLAWDLTWAHCILGFVLAVKGGFPEALAELQRAEELTARHFKPQLQWTRLWRGNILRDLGRLEEAEEEYAQAGEAATIDRAFLRLRQRRFAEGLLLAENALATYQTHESAAERASSQVVLGIALRCNRMPDRAVAQLKRACALFQRLGFWLRLVSAQLHLASLLFETRAEEPAKAVLARALRRAERQRLCHFLWWDPAMVASLCAQGLRHRICPEYLVDLALARLEGDHAAALLPLLTHSDERVRADAERIVDHALKGSRTDHVLRDLFESCGDPITGQRVAEEVASGRLSLGTLSQLRQSFGLTWKEIEVFVCYYLLPSFGAPLDEGRFRRACAERLCLSENTLKSHIKSLRRKLQIDGEAGSMNFLRWAEREGMVTHS